MKYVQDGVVIIFGFSGSGKSSLARALGAKYGLRVIHPSGILRSLLEKKKVDVERSEYNSGFWESPEGVRLFKGRLKDELPMDVVSDKILLDELSRGGVVMDSWSMPWLSKRGVKIYLKTALSRRIERVAMRSGISIKDAKRIIVMKDNETRTMFLRVYGFDIKKDLNVFDFILDTTHLNQEEVMIRTSRFLDIR